MYDRFTILLLLITFASCNTKDDKILLGFNLHAPRIDWEKYEQYEKANADLLDKKYRTYFNKLKTQYTETEYAKMLIQECDDFAKYVTF